MPRLPLVAALLGLFAAAPAAGQGCAPFDVLVFTKTAGFNHAPQIVAGTALIQTLGAANGFGVDQTADATMINAANLAHYAVVVFLNTTGDVLTAAQQTAFEGYILGGGGFVGVHSATDTEYGWPFYGALIGAYFQSHPAVQPATLSVVNASHPATATLPPTFVHTDEWYDFQTNVASNPLVTVLMTIDEATYAGGMMGAPHPIAWCQNVPGFGRSFYTALGHDLGTYSAPFFQAHLLGGILWAADSLRTMNVCGGQVYGTASGSPALTLGGIVTSPTTGALTVAGATPGASGVVGVSTCGASVVSGGLTILVELGSPGLVAFVPIAFDATGQAQVPLPLGVLLPASTGVSLFTQAAQLGPAIGLSNGFELLLCP